MQTFKNKNKKNLPKTMAINMINEAKTKIETQT
jgi:hypothetical protein